MNLGTKYRLEGRSVKLLGGVDIFDPHERTTAAECSIPTVAIHPNAKKIDLMLGQ